MRATEWSLVNVFCSRRCCCFQHVYKSRHLTKTMFHEFSEHSLKRRCGWLLLRDSSKTAKILCSLSLWCVDGLYRLFTSRFDLCSVYRSNNVNFINRTKMCASLWIIWIVMSFWLFRCCAAAAVVVVVVIRVLYCMHCTALLLLLCRLSHRQQIILLFWCSFIFRVWIRFMTSSVCMKNQMTHN